MGRLVDVEDTTLLEWRIGGLPIVNEFLSRLGLQALLDAYVPMDPRAAVTPSASLLVLCRVLIIERAPLYKIGEWSASRPAVLLGLAETEALTDDRIGRALDALFDADRASMLTKLMCAAIETFDISVEELHNDATTLHMQGQYSSLTGDSPRATRVRFGHAKKPQICRLASPCTCTQAFGSSSG